MNMINKNNAPNTTKAKTPKQLTFLEVLEG